MNGPDLLGIARQKLTDAICHYQPPANTPLNISPWLAAALLQKAIRRGADQLALQAAATLLRDAPDRLWRRCGGIANEDVGLADVDAVAIVTAAITGKRFRAQIGGEWAVASFIVSRMARAAKCRAADDLLMTCDLHPDLATARREMAGIPTPELLRLAVGSGPLPERAIALWFASGTYARTTRNLRPRRGEPQLVFNALLDAGFSPTLVELAREGFRKGAEMLAPFVVLLSKLNGHENGTAVDDEFPPEIMVGSVPSWAMDVFSREGVRSLEAFLQGDSATANWVRAHLPASKRVKFLGGILFRLEGGRVRKRLRWPTGDELRRTMDVECHGLYCPNATEVMALLWADIGLLNGVRLRLTGGSI